MMGKCNVKKLAIFAALCGSLICSSAQAKTFVGVLWPMFGPLPAIGLVELTAEIRMMPDVEVHTYLHQEWPTLVEDISHLPEGTHTVVIGYSLGANATPSVANNSKYIDLIIALQPSMLSWNPPFTGKGRVGRIIEVYNPNPWMTFGGMGSKKLEGPNIEYIANNDSHPGAQFNSDFRNLVKTEIAKFATEDRIMMAQGGTPRAANVAQLSRSRGAEPQVDRIAQLLSRQRDTTAKERPQLAQAEASRPQAATKPSPVAQQQLKPQLQPKQQAGELVAFLDKLSSTVNSGALPLERRPAASEERQLTLSDMQDYAARTYRGVSLAGLTKTASD
jgi:hypothetical protein